VAGYALADSLQELRQLTQVSVCDLKSALKRGDAPGVLDVRTPGEWELGHIEGALAIPLPRLARGMGSLPKDRPMAVLCGSGYRSSLGASLLLANGFSRVQNVMGGMAAFQEMKCPEWQAANLVFPIETS